MAEEASSSAWLYSKNFKYAIAWKFWGYAQNILIYGSRE